MAGDNTSPDLSVPYSDNPPPEPSDWVKFLQKLSTNRTAGKIVKAQCDDRVAMANFGPGPKEGWGRRRG